MGKMSKKISLVGIQTLVGRDRSANLKNALEIIDEAASLYGQIDLIVLPEYFYEINYKEEIDSYPEEVLEALSNRARRYGTYIVGGAVLNRTESSKKMRNTSLLFDRSGGVVGNYDKIHLFDVLDCTDEDKESQYIEHGDRLFTYDADFGKLGIIICYDIRFPELARSLALQGVRFLIVPSAFFNPRFDHWTKLIQTTAIQNSMYVLGVNLFGRLSRSISYCGRSLLVDPWGVTVAGASDKACFFQAYIETDFPDEIGDALGTFSNRRPSVY